MQVKKFEAPTIQEALETIKRELGPEAIILQTKKNKRGFGLLSKDSVEVTAAVSERSLQKKQFAETRLPEPSRNALKKMPADRQAEFLERYSDKGPQKNLRNGAGAYAGASRPVPTERGGSAPVDALLNDQVRTAGGRAVPQDRVEVTRKAAPQAPRKTAASTQAKRLTATRYADIDEEEVQTRRSAPMSQEPDDEDYGSGATSIAPKMTVEEEVRLLKRMIEEMKTTQEEHLPSGSGAQALLNPAQGKSGGSLATPALQDAYEQLVLNGMDKRYAWHLLKAVAFELGEERAKNPEEVLDQLAVEIMTSTEVRSPFEEVLARAARPESRESRAGGGPVIVALVGPTGVGKTTTVAKLASDALLRRNLKVGLINLDSYKVAAFDQLGTYAKILNVPFRSCANGEDLRAAIQDFQSLDLVIVDTTGRSQRDPEQLREMQSILAQVPQLRTQLVLSVTTRDTELYDMASRFGMFRPEGIIASKLDEATIYGAIYNVSQKAKLPLIYFTTGQRVPEDIEEASRERVAALILDL